MRPRRSGERAVPSPVLPEGVSPPGPVHVRPGPHSGTSERLVGRVLGRTLRRRRPSHPRRCGRESCSDEPECHAPRPWARRAQEPSDLALRTFGFLSTPGARPSCPALPGREHSPAGPLPSTLPGARQCRFRPSAGGSVGGWRQRPYEPGIRSTSSSETVAPRRMRKSPPHCSTRRQSGPAAW